MPPAEPSRAAGPYTVTLVPKPWGHELIWAYTDRYVGKVLHIKAGHALSVQYHIRKDETIHLLSGEMIYRVRESADGALRELRPPCRRVLAQHAGDRPPDGGGRRLRRPRGVDSRSGRRRPLE